MIVSKKLAITYKQKQILQNVSFEILDGSITVFIGKSGAGKSTILRILAGLETSYQGLLLHNDQDLRTIAHQDRVRLIGYVTQHYTLFPQLTVMQNCSLALKKVMGLSSVQAQQKVREELTTVGMEEFANAYPSQLSGGQKQRVAIARALCLGSKTIILDEPTSALDPENVATMVTLLKKLAAQGLTVILSSQDMLFVKMIFDQVYLVDNGMIVESADKQGLAMSNESRIKAFLTIQEIA